MSLQPSFTLRGHSNWITAVAEIGFQDKIITASQDRTVKLWSLSEKKCLETFSDYNYEVDDVAVVDDATVVTASGCEAQVLRITDGSILATSSSFKNSLQSCSVLDTTTAIVGDVEGNLFKITWKQRSNYIKIVKRKRKAHEKCIRQITVRGDELATCSDDGTVKLWATKSLALRRTFRGHSSYVVCVAFNEDYLVSGSWDDTIRIYDVRTASLISSISTHTNYVRFVHIAQGSNIIVSGSSDGVIALNKLPSGEDITKHEVLKTVASGILLRSGLLSVAHCEPYDVHVFNIEQLRSILLAQPEQSTLERVGDSLVSLQKQSELERTFTDVLSQPSNLTLQLVLDNIRANNVTSSSDLYCGHNIVLLAIRCSVITADEVRKFTGDLWFFEENLYYPASKLVHESGSMLYPIFHHAQQVGIIRDGHGFRREHENRVDTNVQFESIRSSLDKLHARLSNVEDAVETNAKNFQFLFQAIKKKEKRMRYVGFAKVLLSLIPVLGKAFSEAAYASTDFLLSLSTEDIVDTGVKFTEAGVQQISNVDLSNAQLAYSVLSQRRVDEMSQETRTIIMSAVSQSGFQSMEELRLSLKQIIQEIALEDIHVAMLNMGSSEWLENDTVVEETEENEEYYESAVRLQFRAFAVGRRKEHLSIAEATIALNTVVTALELPKEINSTDFELVFITLSEEVEVSEQAFVDVFRSIKANMQTNDEKYLADVYMKKFDVTNVGRTTTGIEFAARTLQCASKSLNVEGLYGVNPVSNVIITPEMMAKFDNDGDGKVERDEFVTAALSILHGIKRS